MGAQLIDELKKDLVCDFKILLVDDRLENLLTLEQIIEGGGRSIIKATSANEALKIVLGDDIHLLLLDVQMPDMDGYEAADLLRLNQKTKHIPIIFVSAVSRNEKNSIDKYEEGTVDFLFKPLDISETKSKVKMFENLHTLNKERELCCLKYDLAMKELDRFVYAVSHDVKAPLRAIENLASWIEGDLAGNSNKNIQENIALLKNRVGRMQNLLSGITEYSRVGRINESREQVNTGDLVRSVIKTLKAPVGFEFKIQENMPVLFTEKTKLQKVFSHLLQNGFLHRGSDSGEITVSCEETPDAYCFSVADDGPGIKPQYHEKVFEIFHTLKSKDALETTGVGLSIAKKIMDSVGQKIWIDATTTSGARVCFTWHK